MMKHQARLATSAPAVQPPRIHRVFALQYGAWFEASATPWSVGALWRIVRTMPASRSRTHVAILFSEHAAPERYVISKLADYWRQDGLHVDYLFETTRYVPADVLMLHIDLSVLPQRILRFASRYPRVINQHVSDIRKRTFSTLIVPRPSEHTGPVIVKTNLNFGGGPESGNHPNPFVRSYHRARRLYLRMLTGSWGYRVYPSTQAVPKLAWCDPYLVVEKFVPERLGDDYAVRVYNFFGERDSSFLVTSRDPIVKGGAEARIQPLEPDPRLRVLRRSLKLDYGKIDYVLSGGEPVVLDINKTVGLTDTADEPSVERARRDRARAIYDFLP